MMPNTAPPFFSRQSSIGANSRPLSQSGSTYSVTGFQFMRLLEGWQARMGESDVAPLSFSGPGGAGLRATLDCPHASLGGRVGAFNFLPHTGASIHSSFDFSAFR